jgi:hypothetical protein
MNYEQTLKEFERQVKDGMSTITVNASDFLVTEDLLEVMDEIIEERTGSYSESILIGKDDLFYLSLNGWVSIIVINCKDIDNDTDERFTNEIWKGLEKIVEGLDKNRKR